MVKGNRKAKKAAHAHSKATGQKYIKALEPTGATVMDRASLDSVMDAHGESYRSGWRGCKCGQEWPEITYPAAFEKAVEDHRREELLKAINAGASAKQKSSRPRLGLMQVVLFEDGSGAMVIGAWDAKRAHDLILQYCPLLSLELRDLLEYRPSIERGYVIGRAPLVHSSWMPDAWGDQTAVVWRGERERCYVCASKLKSHSEACHNRNCRDCDGVAYNDDEESSCNCRCHAWG